MIDRPIRVFVLRGVDGSGGGADKIILRTAAHAAANELTVQLCFMRHRADTQFDLDRRAHDLGLNYAEVRHRGPFDRTVISQLQSQVESFAPDLIHSHDYKANFYATWLSRRTGIPRISTSHGWTGHGFRERWIYYPADKRILRHFDARIGVSTDICQQLIRRGAPSETTYLLLNGIDPAVFRANADHRCSVRDELGFTDQHVVLGAVGRIEKQKRFDLLLTAFRQIHERLPSARLVIAGDGSLLEILRRDVVNRNLSSYVQVLGHVSDMKRLYQAFDRLVQSSDYEGTPTVVVEAMAMEIPVIATDAGGTAQLLQDGREGWIVPVGEPYLLANAVLASVEFPDDARTRAVAGRRRVEAELSFDHRMNQLAAIYRSVINRRSHSRPEV